MEEKNRIVYKNETKCFNLTEIKTNNLLKNNSFPTSKVNIMNIVLTCNSF